MDSSKLGVGEAIAGVSGLLLFIFMFLPWYGYDAEFAALSNQWSAWEAFTLVDFLLFLVAVVVVGLAIVRLAESTPDLPAPPAQITMIAGVIALVLIVFRLIVAPGLGSDGFDADIDLGREMGIFVSLIAAAGIAYGGWRATNEHQPE